MQQALRRQHRRRTLTRAVVLGCGLLTSSVVSGQDRPENPPALTPNSGGTLRLGPFSIRPRLHIGVIGLDTNVFYTPTDRRSDFTAGGGPGLEVALPIHSSVLLTLGGGGDYLYFLRTQSQRRLTGDGRVRLERIGPRASAALEASYRRSFGRPNFEVDRRIAQDQKLARVEGRVGIGPRLEFRTEASAVRAEVAGHQEFFGADLRRALSRDTYLGRLTTAFRLTAKTSWVIEGDYQLDRFLFDRTRDADSNRLGAGFEILSITRLTGRAVAGLRSFRLRLPPPSASDARASRALEPYALVDLTFHVGPRTRLGAVYDRDLYYSAFAPAGEGRPVIRMETGRVRLEKGLFGNLDLKLFAGLVRLKGDGAIRVERRPGEALVVVRDDTAREAGADLGYLIRGHLRVGLAATYTERRSAIADFGIQGLLVGATITYIP